MNLAPGLYKWGTGLAIDAAGDLYIIGKYRGVVDFDWGSASSISSSGAALSETFLVKFDANGNILWVEIFKGWGEGKAISIDASGIYITGLFYNGMDADPGTGTQTLSSGAYAGAFVIKLTQQILPLRLISFAVTPFSDKTIRLNWKTVLENNTQKFVIERSINGIEFSQIGSVKTKGNENQAIENNYAFDDDISRLSTSLPYLWYRLKMMDKDGKFTYSKTIMIKLYRSEIHFSVYPNPAVDFMYINVASTSQETKTAVVQISDATGKMVKQQKAVLNHNAPCFIDVHTLPAGSYIVSLIGKENFNAKIILVK